MERVERLGEEAWAGVAQVDRGVAPTDWGCADLKCISQRYVLNTTLQPLT